MLLTGNMRQKLKSVGYTAALAVPFLIPLSAELAAKSAWPNIAAWLPLFVLFVLLPSADYLIGKDTENPEVSDEDGLDQAIWFRALTLLCLPIYLGLLFFSARWFLSAELNLFGQLGLLLSQGVIGGVIAINVAHELIHKSQSLESNAGGLLLSSVCYGTFKIEHVKGHHVHVSTPADASSARFGQDVYHFVSRSIPRNVAAAFKLENEALDRQKLIGLKRWLSNEALRWSACSLGIAALMLYTFGWLGVAFFFAQALIAIITLEVINYIEHYGLERQKLPSGRYERTTHLHSWNSSYLLTNLVLFQLQRHSDHHENPRRRYQTLRHFDASPQLPGGYASMFLLALCPPLWFRVINPRVPQRNQ